MEYGIHDPRLNIVKYAKQTLECCYFRGAHRNIGSNDNENT